jgi:hypothetical protein
MVKMSTISGVDCLHVGITVLKWAGQLPLTRREQVTCMMLLRMFFSECILNFYRAPPVTEACCLQKKSYTLRMGICNFFAWIFARPLESPMGTSAWAKCHLIA